MKKITANSLTVFLLSIAFLLVPCTAFVGAQEMEVESIDEEMPFEDFDEDMESLDMEEDVAVPEDEVPLEDEFVFEDEADPFADEEDMPEPEALPMEDEGLVHEGSDEGIDWGEPVEDMEDESAPADEPVAMEEPVAAEEPAMAEEPEPAPGMVPVDDPPVAEAGLPEAGFDVESEVEEIESIETEEVVFDHSSEVIALALKLKAAETEIERLRAGMGDSKRVREELIAALRSDVKQSERQKRSLKRKIEKLAAQLKSAEVEGGGEKRGDLEKAEKEIERLRDLVRRIWQANRREKLNMHYNMAAAYRAGGMIEKAESHYLKALSIDPEDAEVHYNLAILYDDEIKNRRKAREHYEKFLELAPDDRDAPKVVEWLSTMK